MEAVNERFACRIYVLTSENGASLRRMLRNQTFFNGLLSQKRLVHRLQGLLAFGQVNDHRDFDFAGGDHADVDAFAGVLQ